MQKVVPTYKKHIFTHGHGDVSISGGRTATGGGAILTFIYHCCNSAMLSSEGLNIDLHKIIEIQERK